MVALEFETPCVNDSDYSLRRMDQFRILYEY